MDTDLVMDFEKTVQYIMNKTGLSEEIIQSVLDTETQYMIELGIIKYQSENPIGFRRWVVHSIRIREYYCSPTTKLNERIYNI